MIKKQLAEFQALIREGGKKVVVISHPRPDADALGSSLAIKAYLEQYDHHVEVIMPTEYPFFLNWMHDSESIIDFEQEGMHERCADLILGADLIVTLDFSKLSRVGEIGEIIRKSKGLKALVDHHRDPEDFADYVYWDCDSAATCELVYELITSFGDKDKITLDMGEDLYAGIMTDTGSFRHPTTTSRVHRIVADLLDMGVKNSRIHQFIFDNYSEERLRFLGHLLSKKLTVLKDYRTAYIAVSNDELEYFHSQEGDTEGIVNYALSIRGIVLAVFATEKEDHVKFSFRSCGNFPANQFAADHFNGGGHKNAAGGKLDGITLEGAIEKVKKVLPQYRDQLMSVEVVV